MYTKTFLQFILEEAEPKVGTGKKPKGSGRRLYTDEDPTDTVPVKYRTREDIIATLNRSDFKSKSHARKSQIINLIQQRLKVALKRAVEPEVKTRLKRGLEYIEARRKESKRLTKERVDESIDTPLERLSPERELPMVKGIADILKMVEDPDNRRRIALHQVEEFKREGILFRYSDFLKLCGVTS